MTDDATRIAAIQARFTSKDWYDITAHSGDDIPWLLAALARLQAENSALARECREAFGRGRQDALTDVARLQAERDEARAASERHINAYHVAFTERAAAEAARDAALTAHAATAHALVDACSARDTYHEARDELEAAMRKAIGFHQVTHTHAILEAALRARAEAKEER